MITPDTACQIKQEHKRITIGHGVKEILKQLAVTSKKKCQALQIYFKTNDNRQTVHKKQCNVQQTVLM